MKINELKSIINNDELPDDIKEHLILKHIADDEKAIPTMLEILAVERKKKKELITEMNAQLSRAHVAITSPKLNKEGFVQDEIITFYTKYKDQIGHLYINLEKL